MKKVYFVWGVLMVILGLSSCSHKGDINKEMHEQKQMVNRSVQGEMEDEPATHHVSKHKQSAKKECLKGQFRNSRGECEEYSQFDKPYRKGGR